MREQRHPKLAVGPDRPGPASRAPAGGWASGSHKAWGPRPRLTLLRGSSLGDGTVVRLQPGVALGLL